MTKPEEILKKIIEDGLVCLNFENKQGFTVDIHRDAYNEEMAIDGVYTVRIFKKAETK